MKKYKGEFWLSGEEDKTFLGEIELGKRRSQLSLTVPVSDKPDGGKFLQSDPLRPVVGLTTCGKRITLTDYFQVYFPHSFYQPRCARFCINAAFVALPHEIGQCDPEVETAIIASKPLVEWCGLSSHKTDPGPSWTAKYSPSDPKEIYKGTDYAIELVFGASMETSRTRASIADNTSIKLKTERPLAWSRLFTALSSILDVVSIGCGGYCRISHAYAKSRDPIYRAAYHFHSLFPNSKVPPFARWLFALRDLPESAFNKWMEKAGELSRARALFFSAKHHKMFTETRVILLTQAVEAYCRRVHRDQDHSKLNVHLKALCSEYEEPISVVFPGWARRVTEVLKFRGQQAHSPLKMPTNYMASEERIAIEHFLCLILEICFMSQLDMTTARITQLIEHSVYYRQLGDIYGSAP